MAIEVAEVGSGGAEEADGIDCQAVEVADEGLAAAGVTAQELGVCVDVLQKLDAARSAIDWHATELRSLRKALALHNEAFGALPQKDELDKRKKAKIEKDNKRERRMRQQEADKKWKENTVLRASRLAKLEALEATNPAGKALSIADGVAEGAGELHFDVGGPLRIPDGPVKEMDTLEEAEQQEEGVFSRQQACYICKARFSECHHFYASLCPPCAGLNYAKRNFRVDMCGRVCLVTGARVKIGFETTLKLLRMGARVIATTRFPRDALRRYAAEKDSSDWRSRLEVCGLDFRFLAHVEQFCDSVIAREGWLDVIVNNACQTIRRPAGYYAHLIDGESVGGPSVADGDRPAIQRLMLADSCGQDVPVICAGQETASHGTSTSFAPAARSFASSAVSLAPGACDSAAMSQLAVLAEDSMPADEAATVLPAGQRDAHGQQLDVRSSNSWLLKLGEVSTPEAVEVFCINTLTPFVLNGRLRPLLERSPRADRYIVNVSAMEGKFYRWKQPTHPHTNMAKAALNMMTKTSAEDYARSGIYMNSVDTGWINDENPLPLARRLAATGFQTPIDEVDAAARILDPVLIGMEAVVAANAAAGNEDAQQSPAVTPQVFGKFLKDYAPTEW